MAIILYIPYSRKILRTPIFEDFEVLLNLENFILEFCQKSRIDLSGRFAITVQ